MSLTETDAASSAQPPRALSPEEGVERALRRLNALSPIDEDDRDLVWSGLGARSEHRVGSDLGDDSDDSCRILLSGWACRISENPWGGRQILDVLVPGDAIGLSLRPRLDGLYRIVSLGRATTIDASLLRDRMRIDTAAYAGIRRACLLDERSIASRMIEHTSRLGGAGSTQAMAHLLLELRSRLADVDLLDGVRFPMPLSQENLHEMLGITATQVYRVLTQLRRDGLIVLGSGWAEIPDPHALAKSAGLKHWRG